MSPLVLYNSQGKRLSLRGQLSKGGEGTIYEVADNPHCVAKIYHQGLAQQREEKLRSMLNLKTDRLLKIAAWPTELLYDKSKSNFVGFLMNKITSSENLHCLYGKDRKLLFPQARWKFLIHTAMNIAGVVNAVHEHGHIVGDLNESGILVSKSATKSATVTLVDCDSFQIKTQSERLYLCGVGKPEYTPPELFGQPFDKTVQTKEHDFFRLAIIIFQLLFLGRHPFAGTPLNGRDTSLEDAIKKYRFAYGDDAKTRNVKPPPYILKLEETSETIAKLFRRSFLPGKERPTAKDWISALKTLSTELKTCDLNDGHNYFRNLSSCPWCRAEAQSNVIFFECLQFTLPYNTVIFNLTAVWQQISEIKSPGPIPALPEKSSLQPKRWQRIRYFLKIHFVGKVLISGTITFVAASVLLVMLLNGVTTFWLICTGLIAAIIVNSIIQSDILIPETLKKAKREAEKKWNGLVEKYQVQNDEKRFNEKFKQLELKKKEYLNLDSLRLQKLQELERTIREKQLQRFLDKHKILSSYIPDIGPSRTITLRSYNIETAADVTWQSISSVPGFGPVLTSRLLTWRKSIESKFVFNHTTGVNPSDKEAVEREIANNRSILERELSNGPSQLQQLIREIRNSREFSRPLLINALQSLVKAENEIAQIGKVWIRAIILTAFAFTVITMISQRNYIQHSLFINYTKPLITSVPTPTPQPVNKPTVQNSNELFYTKEEEAKFYYEQGVNKTKAGKYAEAVSNYQESIVANPNLAEAYHELGYALYKLGKYKESIEASKKAISLAPRKTDTYRNLGLAYQAIKQWENARQSFEQASKLNPNNAANYLNLGFCLAQTGNVEAAIEAYKSAIRLNSNLAQAHYEVALLYIDVENQAAAIEEYEKLRSLNSPLADKVYEKIYP